MPSRLTGTFRRTTAASLAHALESWFRGAGRDLPWRQAHPDPDINAYRVFVSEIMLQQTQVGRVVDRFSAFIATFPTIGHLARADEQDVLIAWQGLGYYRRARHLHRAARLIWDNHRGRIPADPTELKQLPGIGRYTAGAIASIAFGRRTPLVDGNVTRVALRILGSEAPQSDATTQREVWSWAEQIVAHAKDPSCLNQALMELGATICTPRAPRCDECPVRTKCHARKKRMTEQIPRPKVLAAPRDIQASSFLIRLRDGSFLLQQRPPVGMWSSMWQIPTIETDHRPNRRLLREFLDRLPGCRGTMLSAPPSSCFRHQTTHRTFRFSMYEVDLQTSKPPPCTLPFRWCQRENLESLPLSNAQRHLLALGVGGAPPARRVNASYGENKKSRLKSGSEDEIDTGLDCTSAQPAPPCQQQAARAEENARRRSRNDIFSKRLFDKRDIRKVK